VKDAGHRIPKGFEDTTVITEAWMLKAVLEAKGKGS